MARVTGIGGVFFRSPDPRALSAWYDTHLGVTEFMEQDAGPTVFAPFAIDTTYFDRPEQQFMLNFRVDDLDAVMAQLVSAGIDIETRAEWDSPETGRFARIHDPDGNPIELWEPSVPPVS